MNNVFCKKRLLVIPLALLLIAPTVQAATSVEVAREPQGPWKSYPTRTLADLPELAALKPDTGLSQYGGWKAHQTKATGFFHPKQIDGRWWLVDPEGCLFLQRGIAAVSQLGTPGARAARQKIFGGDREWATQTAQFMREHGFTGLGAWSATEPLRKRESAAGLYAYLEFHERLWGEARRHLPKVRPHGLSQ